MVVSVVRSGSVLVCGCTLRGGVVVAVTSSRKRKNMASIKKMAENETHSEEFFDCLKCCTVMFKKLTMTANQFKINDFINTSLPVQLVGLLAFSAAVLAVTCHTVIER